MSRHVALGPDIDVTNQELCPGGDEPCDVAQACTECSMRVCPEHSDDFTTCVDGGLHCGDCRLECRHCLIEGAGDDYEDRFELDMRGDH